MPDDHRPATPQVSVVDDQFGTHRIATDQIDELVVRIWQISRTHETRAWPPAVGLYRAVVLTLVYVRQNLNQAAVGD